MREKRNTVWVDRFQTHLFIRIGVYFACYQALFWCVFLFDRYLSAQLETLIGPVAETFGFLLFAGIMLTLGLAFIVDSMRFAHCIVGPVGRVRGVIQAIAAGEDMSPLKLRQDDFLQELKDDCNELLNVLAVRGAIVVRESDAKPEPVGAGR